MLTYIQIPAFDRVYDALDTYKRKTDMPKIASSELHTGDIVLHSFPYSLSAVPAAQFRDKFYINLIDIAFDFILTFSLENSVP